MFKIQQSKDFARTLNQLNGSIILSAYHCGKVIMIAPKDDENIVQIPVSYQKPMGIAVGNEKLAIATLRELKFFSKTAGLAKTFPIAPEKYDFLYVPRSTFYTNGIDLHDLSFGEKGIWGVNTLFSCICTFDLEYNFTPRWQPRFITELRPEDRCHLNGMAMLDGKPKVVSALSATNTARGWKNTPLNSGVLMDVETNEIVMNELPIPHSPRIHEGRLYLCLSGTGEVLQIDPENYTIEHVFKTGSFLRGMCFTGEYMILGVSAVRKSDSDFGQLPVAETSKKGGLKIIHLPTKKMVAEAMYEDTVEQLYDVQFLEGVRRAGIVNTYNEMYQDAITTPTFSMWKKSQKKKK